jgi:hypothetical protein
MELAKSTSNSELDKMLKKLPEDQKYELLLQSYCQQILEDKKQDVDSLSKMFTLYGEMITKKMRPTSRSCQSLLDSAATFCSADVLGKAIQLSKASGQLKSFGGLISMIPDPLRTKKDILPSLEIPKDNREQEILFATIVLSLATSYVLLQLASLFNSDLHSFATIDLGIATILAGIDVGLTGGKKLKDAAGGIDRLVLADEEREGHSEAAAFLAGYLMGLPSFCYFPDVPEALRMLQDYRECMSVFKQSLARSVSSQSNRMRESSDEEEESKFSLAYFMEPQIGGDIDTEGLAIGRILVWLMAPVAAENLKYEKSVVSDPRRAGRFLEVLINGTNMKNKSQNMDNINRVINTNILPKDKEGQNALLRWAYYEAVVLCKQYSDVLDDVRDFLRTGTSSTGECSLLIENELSN